MYVYVVLLALIAYIVYKSSQGPDVKKMVQKCAKWATTAQQDASLLTGIMHSNYAVGYLLSLKELASPKEIHRQTGVDFKKFEEQPKFILEDVKGGGILNFTAELLDEFESYLKLEILEMISSTTYFTQTEDEDKCEYCAYAGICNVK